MDYSTQGEWDRADALQRGADNPDAAWVVTDRDVVHANPFYSGPPVPHPDDCWGYDDEEEEALSDAAADEAEAAAEEAWASEPYEDVDEDGGLDIRF